MFKGLLTAKSNNVLDSKFSEGIFDYTYQELGETIASIKESNLTALTFNYLTSHDALGSIIVGASSTDQLDENVKLSTFKRHKFRSFKSSTRARENLEYTQHLK